MTTDAQDRALDDLKASKGHDILAVTPMPHRPGFYFVEAFWIDRFQESHLTACYRLSPAGAIEPTTGRTDHA